MKSILESTNQQLTHKNQNLAKENENLSKKLSTIENTNADHSAKLRKLKHEKEAMESELKEKLEDKRQALQKVIEERNMLNL